MLYVKGSTGSTIVRFQEQKGANKILATFLTDNVVVSIDRSTSQSMLLGLKALETHMQLLCGAPSIVSDIPELA